MGQLSPYKKALSMTMPFLIVYLPFPQKVYITIKSLNIQGSNHQAVGPDTSYNIHLVSA